MPDNLDTMDPGTRRHIRFRLLQFLMLVMIGMFLFIAAIAEPIFGSADLGWTFLVLLLLALLGFWWSGQQAERRRPGFNHQAYVPGE